MADGTLRAHTEHSATPRDPAVTLPAPGCRFLRVSARDDDRLQCVSRVVAPFLRWVDPQEPTGWMRLIASAPATTRCHYPPQTCQAP